MGVYVFYLYAVAIGHPFSVAVGPAIGYVLSYYIRPGTDGA